MVPVKRFFMYISLIAFIYDESKYALMTINNLTFRKTGSVLNYQLKELLATQRDSIVIDPKKKGLSLTTRKVMKSLIKNKLYKRLYWLIISILSCWIIYTIFVSILNRFINDCTSIGVETTYLHWENTFPAVSICLTKNRASSSVVEFVRTHKIEYNVPENTYAKNIHDYIFTSPNSLFIKEEQCKGLNSTCGVDILYVRRQLLPLSCSKFVQNVTFRNKFYTNCEDVFKFHELEMGYCFLANNFIDYYKTNLPLKFSASEEKRELTFFLQKGFLWKYQLYVHSPEDLPYFNAVSYDLHSDATTYSFNVEEVYSDSELINEDLSQRRCKFVNESIEGSDNFYSFSDCMSYIRIKMELLSCNCTLFTSPKKYSNKFCDIKGIQCLLRADIPIKVKDFIATNYTCFPSCMEQQITFVGTSEENSMFSKDFFFVKVEIKNAPTLRYHRISTQNKLDLIVSAGGVIGLFIGASLLNMVEIISFCLLFCTRKVLT